MSGDGGPSDILCKYYLSGVCTRGSRCPFSHDTSKPLNQVCKYFLAGCCSYGSRCRYEHVRPEWTAQAAGTAAQRATPPPAPRPEADDLADQLPLSALRLGGRAPDRAPLPVSLPELPFESAQATSLSGSSSSSSGDDEGKDEGKDRQAAEAFAAAATTCDDAQAWQLRVRQQGWGSDDASWHDWRQQGQDEWRPAEVIGGAPAWSLPAAGDSGAWEPQGPQPVTAMSSLCSQHHTTGSCSMGDACKLIHGNRCDLCQRFALHPTDAEARARHRSECSRRHQRLAQLAQSADVECSICMERVMGKAPAERRFGLLACEHPFCLGCIRSWRQKTDGGADVDTALRTCPICRTPAFFVTPSTVWPASKEEREAIVEGYRGRLASIDCKWFARGEGTCPFGTSCFYCHRYPDGRPEDTTLRRAAVDEGEVRVLAPVRLSDFIQLSSAGQRLGRRGR